MLERVLDGDQLAWSRLVEVYSPLVYSLCRSCGVTSADAADILQEVFQSVFCSIGRFRRDRTGDSLRNWLRTITRNKIRDHMRRQRCRPAAAGGTTAKTRFESVPERLSESSEEEVEIGANSLMLRHLLKEIQPRFEARTWQAFWMYVVEDKCPGDIAEQLGMSVGAIRNARYKILRRLRAELSGT